MAARHVSVVVPTKNAERTLARCLASLQRQTAPPLEVIVVDNFSTDATVAIAERCGTRVYRHGSERSEQRNCGTRLARGDCVLFVDADMYLQPGAVAASARALLDHDAVVLPEASFGAGFWARCRALERRCYLGSSLEAARGFRREVLTRLGGYDENLFAFEDWDLHNRCAAAGYRVGRAGSGQILVRTRRGLVEFGAKRAQKTLLRRRAATLRCQAPTPGKAANRGVATPEVAAAPLASVGPPSPTHRRGYCVESGRGVGRKGRRPKPRSTGRTAQPKGG